MPAFNPVPRNACIYTPAELEANQAGRLTSPQAEWLRAHVELRRHQLRSDWIKFIPITLVLTGGSVWIGFGPIGFCMSAMLLILYFLPAWMRLQRGWNQHILADADEGRVFTATGVVTLYTRILPEDQREVQYWLHMGNLNLLIDHLTYARIDPDETYTVFYAPRSKIAVLVQPREGSYPARLANRQEQTPDDRQHNERQRLSPAQAKRLRREMLGEQVMLIVTLIILGMVAGAGILLLIETIPARTQWFESVVSIVMIALPVLYTVSRNGLRPLMRGLVVKWQDVQEGILQTTEGTLTYDDALDPNGFAQIRVGGEVLGIRHEMINMLETGELHRVFYLPRSRIVISIEGLGASSNPQDESQSS